MALPVTVANFLRSPNRSTATALGKTFRTHLGRLPRVDREPDGVRPPTEVVVYFAENPRRLYQLEQWLPVLPELDARHSVQIVTRNLETLRRVQEQSTLPAVYARRLADVLELYDEMDPKIAIYVNNGVSNFQSLAVSTILHVHVNHGESDKVSMVSNQAKAYDRVFVAGEAAERRHAAALIDFDHRNLVRIGRPQLDLKFPAVLPETDRATVIYAPTWEGENDFNNYSSIDRFGVAIVTALLAQPGTRVVYRPHPRIGTSTILEVIAAHQRVIDLLTAARHKDPAAGHAIVTDGNILALLQHCDAMVTDVSSVGLDFLYLRTEKPLFITDRRDDREELTRDAPISAAADVIDGSTIATFGSVLAQRLKDDMRREERRRMRRFSIFGDLEPGESTERFLDAVSEVIRQRDDLLARLGHAHEHAAWAAAEAGDMNGDDDEARIPGEHSSNPAGPHPAHREARPRGSEPGREPDPVTPGWPGALLTPAARRPRPPFSDPPVVVPHRGFGSGTVDGLLENSLPAFREALRHGATWLEVDVRRCGDDELFVLHFPALEDGRFLVDLTGDELRAAGVLALEDLLAELPPGVGVIFDVKTSLEDALRPPGATTTGRLLPVLRRERSSRPLLVTSFDPSVLLLVGRRVPGVARGLITWLSFPLRKAIPAAAQLGLEVVSVHWRSFGRNGADSFAHHREAAYSIGIAHQAGLQVATWSPGLDAAAELAEAGVDAIITDDLPAALRRFA